MSTIRQFGLIGKSLKHSFSPSYFNEKFTRESIDDAVYHLYELPDIKDFCALIDKHQFTGLNVTIPYKEAVIPYLDRLTNEALAIGAVNTIQFKNGSLIGHNTDVVGAKISIKKRIDKQKIENALILGTGGASKAIQFVLANMDIPFQLVSRSKGDLKYQQINKDLIDRSQLIINTTPLGTFPNTNECPNLPYDFLTDKHLLFDLVYNPKITLFLKKGLENACQVMNGEMMLIEQAEAAWTIWNND